MIFFFFSSRRRHTRWNCDWSSDVCSSDLRLTESFYVLANARHLSSDSVSLAREILESSHVAVTPGAAFGTNAEGYLRFSYASSLERIHAGLDRLRRFLGEARRRG